MAKKHNVKVNVDTDSFNAKKPLARENPNGYFDLYPSWSFSKCDFEHDRWSLEKSDFFNEIIPKLISFEHRKWSDIENDKYHNHWIEFEKFTKEAQKRMGEINLYYDELFSLHLTGTLRLFGYIDNGVYFIIWYDPDHEICPSLKKHT